MLGECGEEEEAADLGLVGMTSVWRILGVDVERRRRLLHQKRKIARAARGTPTPTPTPTPTSRPLCECLVADKVEAGSVTLMVAEPRRVLWLPSDVTT